MFLFDSDSYVFVYGADTPVTSEGHACKHADLSHKYVYISFDGLIFVFLHMQQTVTVTGQQKTHLTRPCVIGCRQLQGVGLPRWAGLCVTQYGCALLGSTGLKVTFSRVQFNFRSFMSRFTCICLSRSVEASRLAAGATMTSSAANFTVKLQEHSGLTAQLLAC